MATRLPAFIKNCRVKNFGWTVLASVTTSFEDIAGCPVAAIRKEAENDEEEKKRRVRNRGERSLLM